MLTCGNCHPISHRPSLALQRGSPSQTGWLVLWLTSITGTRSDSSGATHLTGAMTTPWFSLELYSITGKLLALGVITVASLFIYLTL